MEASDNDAVVDAVDDADATDAVDAFDACVVDVVKADMLVLIKLLIADCRGRDMSST